MELLVGKLAGFCGGVINSVVKTEKLLDEYGKIFCLGELVHNKQVVDKLANSGLTIVESLEEVPNNERVIIRAHGIAKEVYETAKDKNIELFDLTCPNVLKIHDEACKLVDEEYFVVLIAQKNHPEAIGTISFCGEDSFILENENQLDELISRIEVSKKTKVAVISQTTYSMSRFEMLSSLLRERLGDYELLINNTICAATELRQKETEELSNNVDAMVIIGGKNSSNTKKLYEIASKNCSHSFIIEIVEELKNENMSEYNKIGIMAGASTPKESIDSVIEYLNNL